MKRARVFYGAVGLLLAVSRPGLAEPNAIGEASPRQPLEATAVPGGTWLGDSDAAGESAKRKRSPMLIIRIEGADPKTVLLSVDGAPIPIESLTAEVPVAVGERRIVARSGEQALDVTLFLSEGERDQVRLRFHPELVPALAAAPAAKVPGRPLVVANNSPVVPMDAPSTNDPLRTLGWVGVSVGAAGLVVGVVSGLVVVAKRNELSDSCNSYSCPASVRSQVESHNDWRTVSTLGIATGVVAGLAGVTLLLTHPKQERALALQFSPAAAAVSGSF